MSKVKFIRGLWGVDEKVLEYVKGSDDIDSKISPKSYAFGDSNFALLKRLDKDCELLDSNPEPYSDNCGTKLAIIEKALTEYPEVIFVDWHIKSVGDIPFNLEALRKGSPVKAALRMYRKRQCKWRESDQRKVPASDFIYINGIRSAKELIETWQGMEKPVTLEQVLMKYIDHLTGGWRGSDYYQNYFEIPFFSMSWEKELYTQQKQDVSFISLKDIHEEGVKTLETPQPELAQEEQKVVATPLAYPEPVEPEQPAIVEVIEQVSEKKTYRMYPVDMGTWSNHFSNNKVM